MRRHHPFTRVPNVGRHGALALQAVSTGVAVFLPVVAVVVFLGVALLLLPSPVVAARVSPERELKAAVGGTTVAGRPRG